MVSPPKWANLIEAAATADGLDTALDRLAAEVLALTGSRNALFARMDDDAGTIQLTNGAGPEWTPEARGRSFRIDDHPGGGVVAYVAARGTGYMTGDVRTEPRYRELFGTSRSEIAVPVADRFGRIRAVLNVESDRADHYTEEAMEVCRAVASLAAMALERDERGRREEALLRIGHALDQADTEDELIGAVLDVAGGVLRFQSLSIFLFDIARGEYVLRGSVGQLRDRVGVASYPPGEGLTGWVCAEGRPLRLEQPQSDPRWRGRVLEFPSEQIASFLAVPVVLRGRSVGAIRVVRRVGDNPYQDNRFTDEDERLLSVIAEQLALGLESLRGLRKALRLERMAAWGELSAKSSHMIGNRVFALRGDVNELGHLLDTTPPPLDALREIHRSLGTNVTRVEEILHEFRDFVMATHVDRQPADLNAIVEGAVREVFPRRTRVRLLFEFESGLPEVEVDARKLRRAITEVVENSLNYTEEGTLRVSTGYADGAMRAAGKLPPRSRALFIEIADEGPGVSPDRKEVIFQPFHSTRVKGMGLGLSIVRGILEGHGGTAVELGAPGEGARFVMLLPLPDPSVEA